VRTRSPRKSLRTARSLGLLLSFAIAPLYLSAQSQSVAGSQTQTTALTPGAPPRLRFEVASIHPHRFAGDEPSDRRVFPGGRFVATATTVRTLLRVAFGTDDNRMSGAPGWTDSETFDINATTADHAEIRNPQQFQQLILSLLEDRFQLKFHREQKEGSIYWLELDKPEKLGPALRLSTPESKPNLSTNSNGSRATMKASNMSMTDIAAALSRQAGRRVEDHTGIKDNFDFEIQWSPEETPNSVDPSLDTVLKEQLGLKLKPAKGSIETVVIDQIAHPSAN
jgi:uncharacterized protein (TIGR03435 family)